MTSQAPERPDPGNEDLEERRIRAFVTLFNEIRTMDIKPDALHALLDDDEVETERTEDRAREASLT